MTDYWSLSELEAASALEECLDERGAALDRLHEVMRADGQDPSKTLDYTVKSLRPLWAWVMSVVTEAETELSRAESVKQPSWLRYCVGNKANCLESLLLSSTASSLTSAVSLNAALRLLVGVLAISRLKGWVWENHPVPAVGDDGWALGELVQRTA